MARLNLRNALDKATRGFDALRDVGTSIASALAPGLAIGRMLANVVRMWNDLTVGRWVSVTGKRGRAAKSHGFSGQIVEIRDESHDRGYFGRSGISVTSTTVACVQSADDTRRWIPMGQLSPVVAPIAISETPIEVVERKRAAALIVPLYARATGIVTVVSAGKSQASVGTRMRVFWARDGRIGAKALSCAHKGRCECSVSWLDGRAVVGAPSAYDATTITPETVEYLAVKLAECGDLESSEAWFKFHTSIVT
jgi:hypothetical protein